MRWMHLRLEALMASFGGEAIDNRGVIRNFPAQSMVTGLFANALGWTRWMRSEHQRLQDRILFGAVHDADPDTLRMTDYQTAQLRKADKGWTTRGRPLGRAGGANTYPTHQRWRDYHSDLRMSLVVQLNPEGEDPTLERLAAAMQRPVRPLFIGRKPCLPSTPLYAGNREADSALAALIKTPVESDDALLDTDIRLLWQDGEASEQARAVNTYMLTDERNWRSGLHGGGRLVHEGTLPIDRFGNGESAQKEERQ